MRRRCDAWSLSRNVSPSPPISAAAASPRPTASSSRQPAYGRDPGRLNAHYGDRLAFKVYTHITGRYAPYFSKLIAATASEALHVLDALVCHQGDVTISRHHTDDGGDSDHVFALRMLLGFQFAPCIPDLKHRRLYSFENRHYTIDLIFPRHFLQTALIASIGASITEALFEELATTVPRALEGSGDSVGGDGELNPNCRGLA